MGKRLEAAQKTYDKSKDYTMAEGAQIVKDNAKAKFDETVEIHVKLGIDTKKADQQVRTTVALPHGTGKTKRIAVIAKGEHAQEAQQAGADRVGCEDIVEEVLKGKIDFVEFFADFFLCDVKDGGFCVDLADCITLICNKSLGFCVGIFFDFFLIVIILKGQNFFNESIAVFLVNSCLLAEVALFLAAGKERYRNNGSKQNSNKLFHKIIPYSSCIRH